MLRRFLWSKKIVPEPNPEKKDDPQEVVLPEHPKTVAELTPLDTKTGQTS
jgi:hypothetical protein